MRMKREELLRQLEMVSPGLAQKDIIEQSSCFVFQDKKVMTFNDEVSCSVPTTLDVEGAVTADPLLKLLRKMPEDTINIEVVEGELLIKGKGRRLGIRMEKEVLLPVKDIEQPEEWTPIGENFTEAVDIVRHCAGQVEDQFSLTCVHITPEHVEACDNFQIARYPIKTGFEKSTLVRGSSLRHIVGLGIQEFSETENWLHFRGVDGLIFSCRRYMEDYPDLSNFLDVKGSPAVLPKGLVEAVANAEIFSSEGIEENQVLVKLRAGKLTLEGRGPSGWYAERKAIKYDGEPLDFMIAPKILSEIIKRTNECEIAKGRIKIDGGKFRYVSSTSQPTA